MKGGPKIRKHQFAFKKESASGSKLFLGLTCHANENGPNLSFHAYSVACVFLSRKCSWAFPRIFFSDDTLRRL